MKDPISLIILFILLLLINIGIIVWIIISKINLDEWRNNESPSCPSFYCGNIISTGKPGTKCIYQDGTSMFVPYRYDKDGNVQCQLYTLPANVVTDADYSGFKAPGPPKI